MDVLIESALQGILKNAETPVTIVLFWILLKFFEWIPKLWNQQFSTANKAIEAATSSDMRGDENIKGMTVAVQTIAKSGEITSKTLQITAKAQIEQNAILKRVSNVLVDIKGDTSATRSTQYSIEREITKIHTDRLRLESKLDRVGKLTYENTILLKAYKQRKTA